MNKTKYDDWIIKVLSLIEKIVLKANEIKLLMSKFKDINIIHNHILGYSKRIHSASTTPRGHFGIKYSYIKFTLTDDCEKILMENASKLDVYFYDYSYLDLSDKVFYIKGKSAAQRFMLSDDETKYRTTSKINKYIKSGEAFEDMFYISEVSKDEYKSAPDNKKLKIIKNDGI